eukprot:g10166.t1
MARYLQRYPLLGPALQGLRLVVDVHDEENMGQALQEAQQTRGATAKTWSNGELDSGSTVSVWGDLKKRPDMLRLSFTIPKEASPCSDTAPTKASSEDEEAEPGFALPEKETDLEEMLADIRRAVEAQDFSVARDISKPSAKVLFTHKSDPPRDMVLFSINSKETHFATPRLETLHATPVAIPHWPLWFPFCESNKLLRRFSPSSFIMNCTLKVLFLRIDFVVLVDIADKLHTEEECLEILMRSPPAGSEGEEWMGITVPPKCGSLPRICIRESRLKMRPTASDQFQCDLQLEMDDPAQAPTWAYT